MKTEAMELDTNQAIQTQHAMLVVWGLYAQQLGLVDKIEQVKLSQKVREHTPQKKVLEFFVSMLAGCEHLKDISRSAHPLDQDIAVAEAWGQEKWADYSGVSRTLASLSQNETDALIQAFNEIEQTYLEQEIESALSSQGHLVYDADLTGRPVSSTSSSYPDAAFGYMGDTVQLGYQSALVSLHSPTYGRLWMSNRLHPGDTVSVTEAKSLVISAEVRTKVRPLRRPELVEERIKQDKAELGKLQEKAAQGEEVLFSAQAGMHDVQIQLREANSLYTSYKQEYERENRQPTAHCKLTRAQQKVATYQARLPRCEKQLDVAQRRFERRQRHYQDCALMLDHLCSHHQRLLTDNESNLRPVRIIVRIDAGFASRENIDWLIEMGYEILTKERGTSKAKDILTQALSDTTEWDKVGRNATMTTFPSSTLNGTFTYPLDSALLRYQTGATVRQSVLLHFGIDDLVSEPAKWFHFYNQRQTIEAGIKEGKSVFQMHHLKVRSPQALQLQEHLACFAANFVRFAAHWLTLQQTTSIPFDTASVKEMVRVCAHTSAWIWRTADAWLLKFTDHSLFAGRFLRIGNGPIQLPLPMLCSFQFCHF